VAKTVPVDTGKVVFGGGMGGELGRNQEEGIKASRGFWYEGGLRFEFGQLLQEVGRGWMVLA